MYKVIHRPFKPLLTIFKVMKTNVKTSQLKTIFHYLQEYTATASMVSKACNIPQKNICRYKKDLEKKGLLKEVIKSKCRLTGFPAWYLSTNIVHIVPSVLESIRNAKKEENE